ncbi:diguanylate cyclase/phosphodiesterase [Methylobacillus rhizosphaerae]|uniref:Diguanylate cyclase/phosphodiesterase n=1 Tax=Methylobacillus rhizosphaerae TaxID=551994 RepID=A0A238XUX5_9PROT|nr:bifunctional diguanylate cyclase/phosphodiesterase [Methylobacillus rhizosphaerae]SNR62223.1 diguanylate cyclase/phosphodiesterase [Methylobacillus rhizosphaerae]
MLEEFYDLKLVAISLAVAMFASYVALNMTERVNIARGAIAQWWLMGSAVTLGVGIWSMHFIGMLALHMSIPLGYHLGITLISLALAIVVTWFALYQAVQPTLPMKRLIASAVVMGLGVASMHYLGMEAMLMDPSPEYQPWLVLLSILIAIGASGAAMWIAFRLRGRERGRRTLWLRMLASLVMGSAIGGMHYTGMLAASFPLDSVCRMATGENLDDLTVLVITGACILCLVALTLSVLDVKLERRIGKWMQLASSLEEANHELVHRTLHDHLTGLPNRTLLESKAADILQKARKNRGSFAVLFIDIDGFKTINDSLGHYIGDTLLVEAAERLQQAVSAQDIVARLGGDEFVILLDGAKSEDAILVAEKIADVFREPFIAEERELYISISIGVAIYPEHGGSYRELAINADAAMYYTKRTGRNGYSFFESFMHIDTQERLDMMLDLGAALEKRKLVLMYQPKFDASTGEVVGFEGLLRWRHPKLGTVLPGQFISLAEKSGLIIPIGEWVLNEACRQMREWYDTGYPHWHVSINLSALQFAHERLLEIVKETLARWQLPPQCLTLEITETVAMYNVRSTLDMMHQLNQLGVRISIDDFGTGYSSLLYLKRLPAHELKIDRAFISNLGQGNEMDDEAIVSAIINLAHTLNFRVVAEGVETAKQQACLQHLGCDELQGFGLALPMTVEQVRERYANYCKA